MPLTAPQNAQTLVSMRFARVLSPYLESAIRQAASDLGGEINEAAIVDEEVYLILCFPFSKLADIFRDQFSALSQTSVL